VTSTSLGLIGLWYFGLAPSAIGRALSTTPGGVDLERDLADVIPGQEFDPGVESALHFPQ
jgi:hypothetical protein